MKNIGIIGGSFDPIHIGHINLAKDAMKQVGLDFVYFIPAKLQPFKLDIKQTPAEHRLKMIDIAISKDDSLKALDIELKRDGVSYTHLTLEEILAKNERSTLYFICGTDSFLTMNKWKNYRQIFNLCYIVVGSRPNYKEQELINMIKFNEENYNAKVIRIDNIQYNISATDIRTKLSNNEDISSLVTQDVEDYIKEHGLYL